MVFAEGKTEDKQPNTTKKGGFFEVIRIRKGWFMWSGFM